MTGAALLLDVFGWLGRSLWFNGRILG
ncbi:MAG: hypothetical protein KJS91_13905 [Planctomycetes bacterium]|nr:hypothetical protein [Planctomycetota bacterium]